MCILLIVFILIAIPLIVCLSFRKPRKAYIESIVDAAKESKSIIYDFVIEPLKGNSVAIKDILFIPVAFVFILCSIAIFLIILLIIVPTGYILKDYKKEPAEYAEVRNEPKFIFQRDGTRYKVAVSDLAFNPSSQEVIYFNPSDNEFYDHIIRDNLDIIAKTFSSKDKRFIYLPDFNNRLTQDAFMEQIEYESPGHGANAQQNAAAFSVSDIKEAYHIPDDISEPCFVRCIGFENDIDRSSKSFSIHVLESTDADLFLLEIQTYLSLLNNGKPGRLYSLSVKKKDEEERTADDCFDEEIHKISEEIRERVSQLKARGLTSLAITRLIGEIDDNPSRLVIDRHNKIILPDYNKEIKLSPIHKAVFFLFLNHPEGIYFKDLPSYKEELGHIYGSITGREDRDAIDESIEKLTNPFDNSINEKCARIKNAFVSEFREELAQWYFIDGKKGEKKTIKLPRNLVSWGIKD